MPFRFRIGELNLHVCSGRLKWQTHSHRCFPVLPMRHVSVQNTTCTFHHCMECIMQV